MFKDGLVTMHCSDNLTGLVIDASKGEERRDVEMAEYFKQDFEREIPEGS